MQAGVNQLSEKVDLLLARLRMASVADKRVERRSRIFGALTILVILASVGACDLIVDVLPLALPYKVVGIGALILLVILIARRWRAYRRQDLDDRKLQAVQRVLGILRADIPKDSPVALTVDFRRYKTGGKEVARKGAVTLYQHGWLTLVAPLADGNTITLAVTDRVKRKAKRKTTREQYRTEVDLGLRLDKRYGDASDAAQRLRRIPLPKPLGMVTVTPGKQTDGRARRLSASFSTPVTLSEAQLVGGDALLAAVRWTYAGLTPTGPGA